MKKLFIAIIILALVAGCGPAPSNATKTPVPTVAVKKTAASGASAQGYVMPVKHAELAFRTGGRVIEVLVKEGDQVKTGQPLVKLQDAELKAALTAAQADLKNAQRGARPEDIAAAQANVNINKAELELAEAELARYQGSAMGVQLAAAQAEAARAAAALKVAQDDYEALVKGPGFGVPTDADVPGRGLGKYEEQKREQLGLTQASYNVAQQKLWEVQASSSANLKALQTSVEVAKAKVDAAQAKVNLAKAGATPEQIDALKARVAQAQAALDEATLIAPFDGTIAELGINVGEIAAPGNSVVSLADLSQWQVETDDLSEVDVIGVQSGAEVSIKVDALPDAKLTGKVTSIVPRSAVKRGDVTYTVKVTISNPDSKLKWGMTAFVDIRGK